MQSHDRVAEDFSQRQGEQGPRGVAAEVSWGGRKVRETGSSGGKSARKVGGGHGCTDRAPCSKVSLPPPWGREKIFFQLPGPRDAGIRLELLAGEPF